jgi:hypothetical protein
VNCSAETYLADLKIGKTGLGLFSKALDAAPTNLFNNRSKGLELAGFQKLRAKLKSFRCCMAKSLLIQYEN